MAIAMLVDLQGLIPGGRSSFHKTDIASFTELFSSVKIVAKRCVGDGKSAGWFQDGKTSTILSY